MNANQVHFSFTKFSRHGQDICGNANLAYIMDECG